MALIRCTCIYRPSTADEHTASGSSITVACHDPYCPAMATHERAIHPVSSQLRSGSSQ